MRTKLNAAIMSLFILTLFGSCQKEEIISNVQYVDAMYFGECFLMRADNQEHIVIRNQGEYESYFNQKRLNGFSKDCSSANPTAIDFDKYTLIGTKTSGGCISEYEREITQIGNKELIYNINVKYSGLCEMLITSMNWALVPKIKKRTEVIFVVNEINVE